jgi:H+/Cl- antiporter ClcA
MQTKSFWQVLGYSAVLGVFGAIAGLVFLGVTGVGERWYGSTATGWFEGEPWWIAVAAVAGLIVGLLRKLFHTPRKTPGLIEDLHEQHVDSRLVPQIVAISAVSLIGGASLGPEVALGSMGGGAADVIARSRKLDDEAAKTATLAGFAGAFGGLFSSPAMAVVLTLEIARTSRALFGRAFYASVVSSSVAFGIYFAIAGSVFLDLYQVPTYEYEGWNLFAGLALGLLAACVVVVSTLVIKATARAFARLPVPSIFLPVIGGTIFGLIGVMLPLTNFTGSEQLDTALTSAGTLGVGLILATIVAKIFTFAVSTASGFIGGPVFPIMFIGGLTGIAVNAIFPDLPIGLTFTCMLAAVPGAIVAAPFTMVLLAAILTQVGALQTAPILIAVATAYLTVAGIQFLMANRAAAAADGGTGPDVPGRGEHSP